MGLLSFLRKNKQESRSDSTFQSRAEEDSDAVRSRGKRSRTGKERGRASDPVLPEKKRARRRLVGAVALVLAAVVGLPMILDSEPKPVTDDIAIDIPSKDKRSQAGAVQTPPVATAPKLPSNAGLDKDEEVIDPASLPTPSEAAPSTAARSEMPQLVKPEPKPRAEPRAETPRPPKPEGKNEAKPERKTELAHAKPESKPAPHAAEKVDEASRAKAILEGRAEPKPEAKKDSGRFVVQVAALATQDKVDELQGKLRSAGISSFTQKVSTDGGSRTRIRVGPFSSKEEADRVRAKLSKIGLAGTLVPA
ncbi:SPOR domain-containing protein|uniref:SPOR domain-containing protein n=1 Tax=Noviherbaspirillum sp. L7-7A TaxID=2850560 RepID=UPI001C2BA5FB|nr:SPOR domain-containing protein [Noviherbaspirillum sp. L7-7A]MBV0879499.1 SPOR domain-containing protein [Noviherbaspirillum sp. L7-7A]